MAKKVKITVLIFGCKRTWVIKGNTFNKAKKLVEIKFRRKIAETKKMLNVRKVPVYHKINKYEYIAKI